MEWLKDLKKEELPENYQDMLRLLSQGDDAMKIAATIPDPVRAFQVVMALSAYYNKQPFYFSGLDAIISRKKRDYVIANRGRKKVSELVRITGWAERTIYDIYEELAAKKQIDLFSRGGAESAEKERAKA